MWAAIVIIIVALLLVLAAPKPNIENARSAKLGDFQLPRAKHGDPMPLLWGTQRQKSPVLIWYGDFTPVPIKKKVKTGLTSSKKVIVGWKNYMGLDMVLALGPGVRLRKFWGGTKLVWSGNQTVNGDISINQPNLFGGDDRQGGFVGVLRFYDGGFSPPQDAYLQSVISPNVPAYNGMARALFKGAAVWPDKFGPATGFYIGTQTSVQPFSFEVSRITTGLHATYSVMPNGLDVNPWEIAYDVIKGDWGKLGNINADIDLTSWVACAQTCYNEGLGMSLMIQSVISGKDILEETMRLADGLIYQEPSTKKLVAKLIRNDYNPDTLDILDESVIDELKNFAKTTWDNTFNQCRVTFKDRAKDYDENVAVDQDFANINYQQRIKSTEISSPGCTLNDVALVLATRQLSFLNVPIFKCELICNRKASKYRPGDVVKIAYKPYGLTSMVMRISKVNLGSLEQGKVTLTVVQDRYATALPTFAPPDDGGFVPINTSAAPVATRRIITAPYHLARLTGSETPSTFAGNSRLYAMGNKPSSGSYGFNVIQSSDNFATDTVEAGEGLPYNGSGTLVAAITAAAGGVDRILSNVAVQGMSATAIGALNNYSNIASARDGSAMLLINNELFIYVGFTDNGGGQVTFTTLYREVLDTSAGAHAIGDRVWVINSADGLMQPLDTANVTTYVKLLDQTPSSALDPSAAPTDAIVPSDRPARPLRPNYLTLAGSRTPPQQVGQATVQAAWRHRSRLVNDIYAYNDGAQTLETGVQTRLRYQLNGGGYTTVMSSNASENINTTGMTGTLEVVVDTQVTASGLLSLNADTLTVQLIWRVVSSLLHFDGTNGSTTFTDASGKTWTAAGNAQISTAQSKFGGASGLFDGTGDYISTPDHADFSFGNGQFTVECWINPSVTPNNCGFISQWAAATGNQAWAFWMNTNKLCFRFWDGGTYRDTEAVWTPTAGTWYHICATRDISGVVRVFVNGAVHASATFAQTINESPSGCRIGDVEGFALGYNGYMDEARIVKGYAEYTAAFTPPSSPYA